MRGIQARQITLKTLSNFWGPLLYARHGYPVYHLGYREAVSGLLQQIEPCRNLITTGRQGLFRYIFMDQAMLMGRHAAQRIIAGKLDEGQREEIGLEKELFEEKAVSL